jgi:hypothetical protein
MTMIRLLLSTILFFITLIAAAQPATDKATLSQLCGCFDVKFMYAETFAADTGYRYHERETINGGIEYVVPIELTDKKAVLQHLLVINDSVIVKHWREDWVYENPVQWIYKGNHQWEQTQLSAEAVKGKWMQTVWEVSDAPRYQGYSQFVSLDNKIIWQNTTDAPLPRREYTIRNDYNILKRTNRLNITPDGYVHEQDNQKIVRANGIDKLLVEEKGINSYKRVDITKCDAGKKYWQQYSAYWLEVRKVWYDYLATHSTIELKTEIENKPLHSHLYALGTKFVKGQIKQDALSAAIKEVVYKYITTPAATAAVK